MSNKKSCQYCFSDFDGDRHRRTQEHIFPQGLIDLFPEQYISFNDHGVYVDNKGSTISDVCRLCNNEFLSFLDAYGNSLISSQFFENIEPSKRDNVFEKELDYFLLTRWLLKILYNYHRSRKDDVSWFKRAMGYILHGLLVENFNLSFFVGMHINTTPLPEEDYNYLPLQINERPKLLGNSLAISAYGVDPYINSISIKNAWNSYCIRFGTAVFYCILWRANTDKDVRKSYDNLLVEKFSFTKIMSSKSLYSFKCISAHTNTVMGYTHLVSNSGLTQDEQIVRSTLGGRTAHEVQADILSDRTPEDMERGRVLVENAVFPNNKKIQRKFQQHFGNNN